MFKKKANVIPIFKKGEKWHKENYRLVNLSLIPGKVIGCIIMEITSKHMKDKKVTRTSVFGLSGEGFGGRGRSH